MAHSFACENWGSVSVSRDARKSTKTREAVFESGRHASTPASICWGESSTEDRSKAERWSFQGCTNTGIESTKVLVAVKYTPLPYVNDIFVEISTM